MHEHVDGKLSNQQTTTLTCHLCCYSPIHTLLLTFFCRFFPSRFCLCRAGVTKTGTVYAALQDALRREVSAWTELPGVNVSDWVRSQLDLQFSLSRTALTVLRADTSQSYTACSWDAKQANKQACKQPNNRLVNQPTNLPIYYAFFCFVFQPLLPAGTSGGNTKD